MKYASLATLLFLFVLTGFGQTKAIPAAQVMTAAYKKAAEENKNVLVIFHASWCGWCHKMDASMNDLQCRKFFADNYVTVHLTVLESTENKHLENEGAIEMLKRYKGNEAGIPFWLVRDKNGQLLKDSFRKKEDGSASNIGCPASAEEVAAFVQILKATSSLKKKRIRSYNDSFSKE